ncbi:DoxX protein [Flavobacterium stagni]|uniref:DoxX protein n=1 Tax=Flavobacterium stagni TaxID=2506421 RepID=A0A4Q1KCZ5_9FLAO|nr:DoxX protein [Flavobacterium stagni]RXR24113.1 DoxX protein [Flavobacterium stagni]
MNSMFTRIVRILLGLILVVFGLNKLMPSPFIPLPQLPPDAAAFMTSLASTGYVLKVVGILEVVIGALLLLKKWVAFALILLAPISLNILLFHMFLDASGMAVAIVIAALNGILIYKHWSQYRSLFL